MIAAQSLDESLFSVKFYFFLETFGENLRYRSLLKWDFCGFSMIRQK